MPHNVVSDQGLYCLLAGFSIKQNRINRPNTPKKISGCIQHIAVKESTSIHGLKYLFFCRNPVYEKEKSAVERECKITRGI